MDGTSAEGPEGNIITTVAEPAPPPPATPKPLLTVTLAGLQAGMVGVLWMLAWLGVSASRQKDSFWKPANLFATAFYGGQAYQARFVHTTFSGIALYLLIYSLLGAGFAAVVRVRVRPGKTLFLAVLLGVVWYYLTFRLLWRSAIPLAYLWHAENPTLIGHLIYGTFLGRFQVYLEPRRPSPQTAVNAAPAVAVGTPPSEATAEWPVMLPVPNGTQSHLIEAGPAEPHPVEADTAEPRPVEPTPAPDRSSSPPDRV
jgi:hypothetical protein